jgi:hypothetical protein
MPLDRITIWSARQRICRVYFISSVLGALILSIVAGAIPNGLWWVTPLLFVGYWVITAGARSWLSTRFILEKRVELRYLEIKWQEELDLVRREAEPAAKRRHQETKSRASDLAGHAKAGVMLVGGITVGMGLLALKLAGQFTKGPGGWVGGELASMAADRLADKLSEKLCGAEAYGEISALGRIQRAIMDAEEAIRIEDENRSNCVGALVVVCWAGCSYTLRDLLFCFISGVVLCVLWTYFRAARRS